MGTERALAVGDIFKTITGDVWFVDSASRSGLYCIHLSAHPTPLTTRKGATKVINRHLSNRVFSLGTVGELVDPGRLDQLQLKRRIRMARKEGTVAEAEVAEGAAPAAEKAKPEPKVAASYLRTDKAPAKELRGQAKEVYEALVKSHGHPKNAKELAALCTFPGSRQEPERVVNFYLAQFKKDGLVTVAPAAQ